MVTAGQAETYLRLRAEAELRRALQLPRHEPETPARASGPQRAAAGLIGLAAPVIARAAQPVLPLGRRTARALQPLGDEAGRVLRPLASRAALKLEPLAGEATDTLHQLRYRSSRALRRAGWRAARVAGARQHAGARLFWAANELSAEGGLRRLRTVAGALALAGAIDRSTSASIVTGLETALLARSLLDPGMSAMRARRMRHQRPVAGAPAGLYSAVPILATLPAVPDSDLGELQLLTLVIAPDRAVLTAAGRIAEPAGTRGLRHSHPLAFLSGSGGAGGPSATDDRGNSYQLSLGSWSESGGDWSGMLELSPVPAAGIRWLDLMMRPGLAAIRVSLADQGSSAGQGNPAGQGSPADQGRQAAAAGPVTAADPAERLIDAAAEGLVCDRPIEILNGGDLAELADVVAALEATGALAPASAALGRLVALARHLEIDVPPVLSNSAEPAGLPAAWTSVLENRLRHDGPQGVAAAAAVLPELDGARFVLAGLHSSPEGAELRVLAWGWQPPHFIFGEMAQDPLSWWARDDAGRWHVGTTGGSSYGGGHAEIELQLTPPLHPDATSLEVMLTGRSGQVSVTVPLRWLEAA